MSEQEILSGRVETVDLALQEFNGEVNTSPVFRVVLDVSSSNSVGALQTGYYIRFNDSVYFISKQSITVFTNSEAGKVFAFLQKTKQLFTISVKHSETLSGHQYIELTDVNSDKSIYTLREFQVFNGLWQTIEGELYENKYSPSIARFTDTRLIWYVKLMPEYPLKFKQVSSISATYVTSQGHLNIYKISTTEPLPGYLYVIREGLRFFNHEFHQKLDVIPLGLERRIIALSRETTITSPEHESIVLQPGEYLLVHPIPRDDVD